MADERIIGLAPTGSSGPFTFASLNDLSRSLQAGEDDSSQFYCSQDTATTAVATDEIFHSNRTSNTSASPQQHKNSLAWYDQVHPIPYPSSPSNIFKQEPLDDKWKYDEAEDETEDDNDDEDDDDQDDGEDEENAPLESIEADERGKKRRKRNKPTLSCRECVGKKMRVSLYLLHF